MKTEIAEVSRLRAWREERLTILSTAEAATAPDSRLELIRPVTSRLGALHADCFGAESKRASTIASAASKALTAPVESELVRRLPLDRELAATVADIRAGRARRLEAATAAEKAAVEPPTAPVAPKAQVKQTAATKPALKSSPKRPARKTKRETTPK